MADFCKGCAVEYFGKDTGDLSGLITKEQFENEDLAATVICEGCGAGYVDHEGNRVKPGESRWEKY